VIAGLQNWGEHIQHDDSQPGFKHRHQIRMKIKSEADLPALNRFLISQDVDIYEFSPQKVSLEDLFLQIVENDQK
jgi:hypothetical protein